MNSLTFHHVAFHFGDNVILGRDVIMYEDKQQLTGSFAQGGLTCQQLALVCLVLKQGCLQNSQNGNQRSDHSGVFGQWMWLPENLATVTGKRNSNTTPA